MSEHCSSLFPGEKGRQVRRLSVDQDLRDNSQAGVMKKVLIRSNMAFERSGTMLACLSLAIRWSGSQQAFPVFSRKRPLPVARCL